jgi:homoserine kinase
MKSVRVRVPATTANLGPGFDCLGVALRLYNTVEVAEGKGADPGQMAREAADLFFRRAKKRRFAFSWKVSGDVPRSRGLGSSVTVRLGILHGLNALVGSPLDRQEIFQLCAELEGHPDNAAPAAFGGFCVVSPGGTVQRHKVGEELKFVVLIPGFELETGRARQVLPTRVSLRDAAHAVGNAAAIASAFSSANYKALVGCFGDTLHQPFREKLMPFLSDVIRAGEKAGAVGGWLSGSGSAVACAALGGAEQVANAMVAASGLDEACAVVVRADNTGARILR